jgi:Fe-S-cluster containining protein
MVRPISMPPRAKPPETSEIVAQVREIYAALATRPAERNCTAQTQCCRFRLTGRTPFLTKAEAIVAAKAWRSAGRTKLPDTDLPDGSCPLLEPRTGRCQIYESRPFGCRTHFCADAGGPYSRRDVADLIHRLEDLSRRVGSADAQPLPAAVTQALREL